MFRFIAAAFTAAVALAGAALADRGFPGTACTPQQFYCGHSLLSGPYYDLWKGRIDASLAARGFALDGPSEYDALFFCNDDGVTLGVDELCLARNVPGYRCQPYNSDVCRGSGVNANDCCGPSALP